MLLLDIAETGVDEVTVISSTLLLSAVLQERRFCYANHLRQAYSFYAMDTTLFTKNIVYDNVIINKKIQQILLFIQYNMIDTYHCNTRTYFET
jgi:hypothetical protein